MTKRFQDRTGNQWNYTTSTIDIEI
jgi:hypothetical protein